MLLTPPNIPVNEFGIPQNQFIGNQFVQPPLPPQQPVSFAQDAAVSAPPQPSVQIGPPARFFDAYQSDYGPDESFQVDPGSSMAAYSNPGASMSFADWSRDYDRDPAGVTTWGTDKEVAEAYAESMGRGRADQPGLYSSLTSGKGFNQALDAYWGNPNSLPNALGLISPVPGLGLVFGAVSDLFNDRQNYNRAMSELGNIGYQSGMYAGEPYSIAPGGLVTGNLPFDLGVLELEDYHARGLAAQAEAEAAAYADTQDFGWSGTAHDLGPEDFAGWSAEAGSLDWDEGGFDDGWGDDDDEDEDPESQ